MKNVFLLLIVLLTISCTSKSKYEKLIGEHVQTDKHGTWTDVQFKIVTIEELPAIKVSDSIEILRKNFDAQKAELLKKYESDLNRWNIYEGMSSDKVLLLPVKCRYSYTLPVNNPRQERTDIFYFTADKSKIIKSHQIKE